MCQAKETTRLTPSFICRNHEISNTMSCPSCYALEEACLKADRRKIKRFDFTTPHKPDSFISFFKTHGFSNDQIQTIIRRIPPIIVSNPIETILPKFQFLLLKTQLSLTVTKSPRFLCSSLDLRSKSYYYNKFLSNFNCQISHETKCSIFA